LIDWLIDWLIDSLIGSRISTAFDWYQDRWPQIGDLEWPWTAVRYFTQRQKRRQLSEESTSNLLKLESHYRRQKCSSESLVFGKICLIGDDTHYLCSSWAFCCLCWEVVTAHVAVSIWVERAAVQTVRCNWKRIGSVSSINLDFEGFPATCVEFTLARGTGEDVQIVHGQTPSWLDRIYSGSCRATNSLLLLITGSEKKMR